MNREDEINKVIEYIANEMKQIENMDIDKNEKLQRSDVLFKLYKVITNLDELEPVLNKFFAKKSSKERFKDER